MDPKRLAQVGVFLFGLTQLPGVIFSIVVLATQGQADPSALAITATHALFVLSLVFVSRGWAAIVDPSGPASSLSGLYRDDLLLSAVPILGLYLLLDGVASAVGSVVEWLNYPPTPDYGRLPLSKFVEASVVFRAVCGAILLVWGSNVVALIRWAQTVGQNRGAA